MNLYGEDSGKVFDYGNATSEQKNENLKKVLDPHTCNYPPVRKTCYELGYWRKHPNLHGYIVRNFAEDGDDNCKPIWLTKDNLETLREAIKSDAIHDEQTTGFFFGESERDEDTKQRDIAIIDNAIKWLKEKERGKNWANVYYCAEW